MNLTEHQLRFEILKKADEVLWNEFIYKKNKWEDDTKENKDAGPYPEPPSIDELFDLAERWKSFVQHL